MDRGVWLWVKSGLIVCDFVGCVGLYVLFWMEFIV